MLLRLMRRHLIAADRVAGTKQVPYQMVCQQAIQLVHQNSAVQSLVQYQYGSERTRHHEAIPNRSIVVPVL